MVSKKCIYTPSREGRKFKKPWRPWLRFQSSLAIFGFANIPLQAEGDWENDEPPGPEVDVYFIMYDYTLNANMLNDEAYSLLAAILDPWQISTYLRNAEVSTTKSCLRTLDYEVEVQTKHGST